MSQDNMHTPVMEPTTPIHTPPGYTHLPLPPLSPTDIRLLSPNINTLHTITPPELGATLDLYQELDPTIIGLQECNKNWKKYDKTEGPLREALARRWPGTKLGTAHCYKPFFSSHHQPGGVSQMVLGKITGRVVARGRDDLGRYTWQETLLDGTQNLIIITAYRVSQESMTGCGPATSAMQQWRRLQTNGVKIPKP
jgi:hypothetical protein